MGEITNHLVKFEKSLTGESQLMPTIAGSMLILMMRGLLSNFNFPYTQFGCANLTGDQLVDPVWETIAQLERQRLKVLCLTSDGASTNRRLWSLHSKGRVLCDRGVLYKILNVYTPEPSHYLYHEPR